MGINSLSFKMPLKFMRKLISLAFLMALIPACMAQVTVMVNQSTHVLTPTFSDFGAANGFGGGSSGTNGFFDTLKVTNNSFLKTINFASGSTNNFFQIYSDGTSVHIVSLDSGVDIQFSENGVNRFGAVSLQADGTIQIQGDVYRQNADGSRWSANQLEGNDAAGNHFATSYSSGNYTSPADFLIDPASGNNVVVGLSSGGQLQVAGGQIVGDGSGLTGIIVASTNIVSKLMQTNLVIGKLYTNTTTASYQICGLAAALVEAGVAGRSSLTVGISGQFTNSPITALTSIVGTIAGSDTNALPTYIIPAGSTYKFTDTSTGAGNSVTLVGGQIFQ